MKSVFLLADLLFVAASLVAQTGPNTGTTEQRFTSGGTIHIRLSSGGYTIRGTDSDTILVTYEQPNRVKVDVKTAGSVADLSISETPHSNFHATIEVPRRSDLWVRLSTGALKVEDMEGSKDVEDGAGEVTIEITDPDEYGHRDASVTTGDLNAAAFHVSKGGLFRSFSENGKGRYSLHVHVGAGSLNLRARPAN